MRVITMNGCDLNLSDLNNYIIYSIFLHAVARGVSSINLVMLLERELHLFADSLVLLEYAIIPMLPNGTCIQTLHTLSMLVVHLLQLRS